MTDISSFLSTSTPCYYLIDNSDMFPERVRGLYLGLCKKFKISPMYSSITKVFQMALVKGISLVSAKEEGDQVCLWFVPANSLNMDAIDALTGLIHDRESDGKEVSVNVCGLFGGKITDTMFFDEDALKQHLMMKVEK